MTDEEYKNWSMADGGLDQYEWHFGPLLEEGRTFQSIIDEFRINIRAKKY